MNNSHRRLFISFLILACLAACDFAATDRESVQALRLAVTTSTRDSGLLDAILPAFEEEEGLRIDVLAVGTGAALKLGMSGDVDMLIVHDRPAEEEFMAGRSGVRHAPLFSNPFVLVGPPGDPAGIRGMGPLAALRHMAETGARYVSRGDDSGTHRRERSLLEKAGLPGLWEGSVESGRGMGATLTMTDQMQATALTDRATFLRFKDKVHLRILVENDPLLTNPYSAIVISRTLRSGAREAAANRLCDYLLSEKTQAQIADFVCAGEHPFTPVAGKKE